MIVQFSCIGCGTTYSVVQVQASAALNSSGLFSCTRSGTPVHHWSGIYRYFDWKRVGPGGWEGGRLRRSL